MVSVWLPEVVNPSRILLEAGFAASGRMTSSFPSVISAPGNVISISLTFTVDAVVILDAPEVNAAKPEQTVALLLRPAVVVFKSNAGAVRVVGVPVQAGPIPRSKKKYAAPLPPDPTKILKLLTLA